MQIWEWNICLLLLLCHTLRDLSLFSRRWTRMCRDVKISPDIPMSIPLTAPWPWGELIPGQCAKLHELQYPPIGGTLASALTQRHRGPHAVSLRTRHPLKDEVLARPGSHFESIHVLSLHMEHVCVHLTLKAEWTKVIKKVKKKSVLALAWRSFILFPITKSKKKKKNSWKKETIHFRQIVRYIHT